MQPRTLLLKHVVLVSVAAMFFVAGPSFAQEKGVSSSEKIGRASCRERV